MGSMKSSLIALAEFSYHFGFIGIDEYFERIKIACWLSEDSSTIKIKDPRLSDDERDLEKDNEEIGDIGLKISCSKSGSRDENLDLPFDENWIEFVFNKQWFFTKSDRDPYPSTPHGHFKGKNNRWPKLNPYTGRVFKTKHQEETSKRLSKNELKKLWSEKRFRSFCREYIMWYMEEFPDYKFPVPHPLRFPRR